MKKYLSGEEARKALLSGAELLAKVVGSSMGPCGRNTVFDNAPGYPVWPTSSRDGVTIARNFYLEEFQDTGSKLVREAADKACKEAGDGTTAAIILAYELYRMGLEALKTRSVVSVKGEIEQHIQLALTYIDDMSRKISGSMIDQVATISANNDPALGKLIADATRSAGPNGIVAVEENTGSGTEIVRIEGMQLNNGYISPVFVNNASKQTVEFRDAVILMLDRPLSSLQGLVQEGKLFDQIARSARPLLILAEDITGEALATFAQNKLQGYLAVCPVKLPSNMGHRKDLLLDIAALTGGQAIIQEMGMDLSTAPVTVLGRADKIVSTSSYTRIVGGKGRKTEIDKRVEQIQGLLGQSPTALEKERLQERLAKLTGGVTMLRLGAQTGIELGDKKDRCEDACFATRCAIEGGIVPGAGQCLARVSQRLPVGIVSAALSRPALQILKNAGMTEDCLHSTLEDKDHNCGTNALTGTLKCNLIESGIIDPTKVVKSSLKNAASVAILMLLTENVIIEIPT